VFADFKTSFAPASVAVLLPKTNERAFSLVESPAVTGRSQRG